MFICQLLENVSFSFRGIMPDELEMRSTQIASIRIEIAF